MSKIWVVEDLTKIVDHSASKALYWQIMLQNHLWYDKEPIVIAYVKEKEDALAITDSVNTYDALRKSHGELVKALKEIEEMGSKTLLGKCCVARSCNGECEVQSKANSAFSQAASIAKEALKQAREIGNTDTPMAQDKQA